jgi:eukaryotic-like serine/threonine-protein kinase
MKLMDTHVMNAAIEHEQKIFQAALDLENHRECQLFLEQACAGDLTLRANISKLLAAHAKADRFFTGVAELMREEDASPSAAGAANVSSAKRSPDIVSDEQTGTLIGHFKILEKIGEGGCGVVYMAEQQEPIRRRVALKIIKLGMDTKAVIARFEQERQALALMDHLSIARVLDAGATETGRPYFVMELVRGIRITEYCDQNQLDTRQRLALFVQVCHAIQHAHQKGVIHRDIKPSNILVTLHDGVPVPKVIDFGIAKATGEERLTDKTLFTSYGYLIGTPAYMSPEQAEMSGLDVDTRSDIYSLGVLLYELLTGATPFDQKELLKSGLDQMRRTLQEKDPHRPSTKLNTLHGTELTRTALHRHTEPPKLRSQLNGDLDWIVMKALEKDRSRRYETANGLAMDIGRHLNNEPVVARPPSQLYRFQKLVHRNKVTFVAVAAVIAALIIGLGASTWLFFGERQARQRAVAAEQQQTRLLREAENRQKLTQATLLLSRDKIEEADRLIGGIPVPEANLEYAAVFRTLGDWHGSHGRWKLAADRFAVLLQINQPDDWDTATLDYLRYGPVLIALDDMAGYERFRRSAIAHYAGTTNPLPAERVVKISLLTPADNQLIRSLRPLAEIAAKSLDGTVPVDPSLAAWRSFSLALMDYRRGSFAEAVVWCERSLNFQNSNAPRGANVRLVLAMSHYRLGQVKQARAEFTEARQQVDSQFDRGLQVGNGADGFWFDWLFAQVLLREASSLIEDNH